MLAFANHRTGNHRSGAALRSVPKSSNQPLPTLMNSRRKAIQMPDSGSQMFAVKAWHAIAHSLDLSRRQMEILMGIFDDEKELVIAERLGISPHTVHTHIERIYQKLGVHSRLDLVRLTVAQFLVLTADITSGVPPICGYWASEACPIRDKFGVPVV